MAEVAEDPTNASSADSSDREGVSSWTCNMSDIAEID